MDATPRRGPTPPEEKRPCWECLRRRLVCDCTRPTCRKCVKTGIVCPGYGNAKPLKWIAPGSVTFRRRRDVPTRSLPSVSPPDDGSSPKSSGSGSGAGSSPRGTVREVGTVPVDPSLRVPRADLKCDTTDIIQAITYCMARLSSSFLFYFFFFFFLATISTPQTLFPPGKTNMAF